MPGVCRRAGFLHTIPRPGARQQRLEFGRRMSLSRFARTFTAGRRSPHAGRVLSRFGDANDSQSSAAPIPPPSSTSTSSSSSTSSSTPSENAPPKEYVHRQYLLALAKANVLPRLMEDEARMKEMGIPREEYGRLMRKEENHGMKGFELVKGLLYRVDWREKEVEEMVWNRFGRAERGGSRGDRYGRAADGREAREARVSRVPAAAPKDAAPLVAPKASIGPREASADQSKGSTSTPKQVPAAGRTPWNTGATPSTSSSNGNATSSSNGNATSSSNGNTNSISPNNILEVLASTYEIRLPQNAQPGTEHRILCPQCGGGSSKEKSLSVSIDAGGMAAKWNCFRASCGFSGGTMRKDGSSVSGNGLTSLSARKKKQVHQPVVRPQVELQPLTEEMLSFFASRGISKETLERNKVSAIDAYDPKLKQNSMVIGFPYYSHDLLVNVKYRTLDKRFWQSKGAEKMLYGLNDVLGNNEIIIVEGEMDKLALEEAGITNVVSVPDGAPARVKEGDLPSAEEDTKYSYLWNSRAWLDQAVRIVIATDNDAPGDALAEELARRLGRERCWRVRWPLTKKDHDYVSASFGDREDETGMGEDSNDQGASVLTTLTDSTTPTAPTDPSDRPDQIDMYYRKDANEVLMKDGAEMLRNFIESAEPLPIRGLLQFHEYYDDIIKYYYLELKDGQGVKTGWSSLDKYYRVVPGELTIVTGVPNSGKSEWIDALLCNLSDQHGWQFAMCSMEKRATDHARQLAEKYVGKPFFDLPYSRGTPRMSFEELDGALDWVDDRFHLIRYEDDELPSVDWVLEVARAAVYRHGIRGLVIDPYNELDHQRPSSMSETEYVSKMLTKVKRFAQTAGVHVWFVAHPRQLHQWKGEAPNLYDISGSAHFINKADNGIVVHRNRDPDSDSPDSVEILVRKVRNKAAGTIGTCELSYDRRNGRYVDRDDPFPPRTSEHVPSSQAASGMASGMASGNAGNGASRGYFVNSDGSVVSAGDESGL